MTPADLRALALAATPTDNLSGHWTDADHHFTPTCSPELILRLLAVIEAAKAMRGALDWRAIGIGKVPEAFDAALAKLRADYAT